MNTPTVSGKIPECLESDIHQFVELQAVRCISRQSESKLREKVKRYFSWVEAFAKQHYISRIQRADDLESSEVQQAKTIARRFIGEKNHDFFVTCVDGRNMPTVMFSKPPHEGGVLRAPAGAVTGFMVAQTAGGVFIDTESFVVQQLKELFTKKKNDTIFYGLDSHLGCAARGQIHATEGGEQKDGGLRSDILSKIMTAKGILHLRSQLLENNQNVAEVIPTFFSYDPHTGGTFAGLELYVDDELIAKQGYTQDVLEKLVSEGKIVSTYHMLHDDAIASEIGKTISAKTSDFRNDYGGSLLRNWRAIDALYANGSGKVFKKLYQDLLVIYKNAGWIIGDQDVLIEKKISDRTIRQKAKFLLKNCVTRYSIAGVEEHWPYDSHQEEMVVITDGGYAPFSAIDAFAVFSRDLNALLPNTKLTIDLIRNSRRVEKIRDTVQKSNLTLDEFIAAPVFVSNKTILKGIREESWKVFRMLDLDKIFSTISWDDMNVLQWKRSQLLAIVHNASAENSRKVEIHDVISFVDGLYELFDRMRIMMKDKYFRQMILHGNIVVFHIMVDENRRPRYLIKLVA